MHNPAWNSDVIVCLKKQELDVLDRVRIGATLRVSSLIQLPCKIYPVQNPRGIGNLANRGGIGHLQHQTL